MPSLENWDGGLNAHGIHVYSTLAYVKVGRKERHPRQTIHTKP